VTEKVTDFSVREQESLRAFQTPEAALLTLSVPGGPMTLLNQVVLALGG